MCGRFLFSSELESPEVQRFCALAERCFPGERWSCGEVLPGMRFPVLVRGREKAVLRLMAWGYEQKNGELLINARGESASVKPTFSADFAQRRCAILTTGFYEWGKDEERTKFRFTGKSDVLYLAGMYNSNGRFVILTTEANASVRGIHHRMPVLLSREMVLTWLKDTHKAQEILRGEMPELTAEAVE